MPPLFLLIETYNYVGDRIKKGTVAKRLGRGTRYYEESVFLHTTRLLPYMSFDVSESFFAKDDCRLTGLVLGSSAALVSAPRDLHRKWHRPAVIAQWSRDLLNL